MEYKEALKFNEKFLDTLDLKKYIEEYDCVNDITDAIEVDYNGLDILPKELEGCVFNYMDLNEITNYLANRYNKNSRSVFIVKYYLY